MYFLHAPAVRAEFPELVAGAVVVTGITAEPSVEHRLGALYDRAAARLAAVRTESDLPEIQAWRRAFARMGLKPTQYRCASESLLRRFRKEGGLPRIHPLVDVCNAVSLASAIPVAAIDLARVEAGLEVRPATGAERYQTFAGTVEHPEPGEITFVDAAGNAHARRWTNRQSGLSAVVDGTREVLIVAEGLHGSAAADVAGVVATVTEELAAVWPVAAKGTLLTVSAPRLEFDV